MKRIVFVMILFIILTVGCATEVKPDSPENTTLLLNLSLLHNDYDRFTSLFSEARKEHIEEHTLEELFEKLVRMKNNSSGRAEFKNFELLAFDHGEMILVSLTPKREGKVEIEDILIVPDELKEFLKVNSW